MSIRRPLDVIEVNQPCPASWEQMTGDDRRRFCSHCNKFVHDLSALSRDEAENLVCESAGELCVRFARDVETQQVITIDYAPAPRPSRRRMIVVFASILSAFGVTGTWAATKLLKKPAPPPRLMIVGALPVRPTPPSVPDGR